MNFQIIRNNNRLEVRNETTESAELVLIGAIGKSWFDDSGITEQEVRDALNAIPRGKRITARINSEGGSVKEGLGIYNAFKERRDDITARISGYALSIASVFPLGAGKVVSPKSAIWMMHKAWAYAQGNADDMRQSAEMLDAHDETLVDIYASETGKSKEEIRAAMEAETWIKGSNAVEWGLADETDSDESEKSACAGRALDSRIVAACKNLRPDVLAALSVPHDADAENSQPTKPIEGKKMETTTVPNVPAAQGVSAEEFRAEKRRRVRAAVLQAGENRIPNDKIDVWVDRCIAGNEDAILEEIKALNPVNVGTPGVSGNRIEMLDNDVEAGTPDGLTGINPRFQIEALANIRKEHRGNAAARYAATRDNYRSLMQAALTKDAKLNRQGVFNANTYSATLVTSFLMDGSLTNLVNMWAYLKAYTRDSSVDPYKPLATGVLKHVTGAETTLTDATNFEPTDGSTVAAKSVTMHQYTQTARVSNSDLNSGLRMEDLMIKNVAAFADKVTAVATAPITAANFTGTPLISSDAAFGLSDLATLQGQLQKSPIKNLILDGTYLARVANTPGFFQPTGAGLNDAGAYGRFGWNGVYLASNWTGAGTNIKGFACNPQAIIGITGLPLTPPNIPGGILQMSTDTLPGLEVGVALFQWFNPGTRTMFVSWDIVAGFAAGDTTAGIVIASGTPS